MEQSLRDEMKKNVDALLAGGKLAGRAVFLFGHCNATEETIDYLLSKNVPVTAILDNSVPKQTLVCHGVPVRPPAAVREFDEAASVVLFATRFYAPMARQLRELGYRGETAKIVDYNSFAAFSLADGVLAAKRARVSRGAGALDALRQRFPTQHLVLCPNNALGDVYWALAFLPAYCKKNGIGETAVVTVAGGCAQVAGLFRAQSLIAVSASEMDELVQAALFTGEENCIIAHHDRPYTDNIIRWLNGHFLSFIDYYRCAVYGLAKGTAPAPPAGMRLFARRDALEAGNSVILAPRAKSVVQPPDAFWEGLAARHAAQGRRVFTNVAQGESPVRGTLPLEVPLAEMADAAEHAGCFIGLRSGLCDVLTEAHCHKIAVYPDCFYSTTNVKVDAFFDMPGWDKIIWRP